MKTKYYLISEFLAVFFVIFSAIFLFSNFSVFYNLFSYRLQENFLSDGNFEKLFNLKKNEFYQEIKANKRIENKIIIPKIFLFASIIFLENDKDDILENLKRGVVHFPESAKPGEKGSTILLGHSSRLLFQSGKYDIAFLFLSKLKEGDKIFLYFKNPSTPLGASKKITYQMAGQRIITSNLSELNLNKKRPALYLVTCWPPGTNLKRLVVEAEPAKNF